jgi:hypothetical protein
MRVVLRGWRPSQLLGLEVVAELVWSTSLRQSYGKAWWKLPTLRRLGLWQIW